MTTDSPLHASLCDLLGIEYPIILAGMGGAAGPTLAAVSDADGPGGICATGYTPDELREMIRFVNSDLGCGSRVKLSCCVGTHPLSQTCSSVRGTAAMSPSATHSVAGPICTRAG